MSDGAAERRLCGCSGVDMNELAILGRISEGIDPRLIDGNPRGDADFVSNAALDLVQAGERHS